MSTQTSPPSKTPQNCPVCGFSNSCILADPRTVAQPCWCFSVSIEPERLARLPADLRDKACLCPRCAGIEQVAAQVIEAPDAP
ncbi:hypothetical protein M2401_000242 [Pseudomonas sp. JUb42]|uniref:cysteine-rich CWC family protein n=1 Tax=Pseudomonas sp. JUb42 TaxID=2940611 RepID=UPI0021686594|nr:cysteine-rich CWC family protein [Pseudomonas sp. JUb42]MCS3466532.1 hypothetical protein [Pseudomonas sp. JUb42]